MPGQTEKAFDFLDGKRGLSPFSLWAKAVDEGKAVKVQIEPIYSGANARPDRFTVVYRIGNGREVRALYQNAPGGV